MQLTIEDATHLVEQALMHAGQSEAHARIAADHIIDCELRGVSYGGLARVVSIAERLDRTGPAPCAPSVEHETPVSARIDGHDNLGYVVGHQATVLAIEKAQAAGVAIVGANNTWYTGMLSYFAEMAAAQGLVSLIASNATPWVAPAGASQGRFGTNPFCAGFPSMGDPIIWDIGTSSVMHAEVILAKRMGVRLDEGLAFDADGAPTREPDAALAGSFAAWGGHKGSGLGHVVQLLGVLAGSPILPPDLAQFGFFIMAMRPDLMMPLAEYRQKVSEYAEAVRTARPANAEIPVRMPFDRSAAARRARLADGVIKVTDLVHARVLELAQGPST